MTTALTVFTVATVWAGTVYLAYRIGVGVGITQTAMAAAEALGEALDSMRDERPEYERRIDIN